MSERLRVWHIAEFYPPDYGGGAAIYVHDLSRYLVERGHEVRVLCVELAARPPYAIRTETIEGVRVDRMNLPYLKGGDPGGWWLGIGGWREHCRRVEAAVEESLGDWPADLVNFHTPYTLYEECLPLIRRRRVPIVGLAHCAWLICPRLRLMRSPTNEPCEGPAPLRCLECLYSHWDGSHAAAAVKLPWRLLKLGAYPAYRLLTRYRARQHVDGLFAYSEFMRAAHEGHVPGPTAHIHLGIDLTGLPTERPQRPRTPLRFGFAGGFQPHKGIGQILDAASVLRRRGVRFEIHVWGPDQEAGAREVSARGLDGAVVVRGMFAADTLWAAYAEMDVLLMATQDNEPFGRVIQEAAAMGAPSIAPAIGGIAEQIKDDVDGLLYGFRDGADLVRQMERVLREPGLFARLSSNLWRVVDTRDTIAAVEEFYRDVIRRSAKVRATS